MAERTPLPAPMPVEDLRRLLDYDAATGIFRRRRTGRVAGCATGGQRRAWIIGVKGRRYLAHRLAWYYVHGVWPVDDIDHKDCDPSNNRIDNLRLADQTQNNGNTGLYRTNKSGFKGVHFSRHAKQWRASIQFRGKMKNLGYFDTPEEAHKTYMAAATELFGEFARAR